MPFRLGQGYDVHRLVAGRPLILGGVAVPHTLGLLGHSDADVLFHAVADALLGALALGDIGQHFPDTDAAYQNADSGQLLAQVMEKIQALGWQVVNVDTTLVAQQPKLAPHIPAMRQNLARHLAIPLDAASIKATTTEQLGFAGRQEGIAAQAVVLLQQNSGA